MEYRLIFFYIIVHGYTGDNPDVGFTCHTFAPCFRGFTVYHYNGSLELNFNPRPVQNNQLLSFVVFAYIHVFIKYRSKELYLMVQMY